MGISEKVAYLKGLMEGLNIDEQTNEGKLFTAIVDVLDEIALEIENARVRTAVTHAYPERTIHLTLIDCEPAPGAEPVALEHDALGWYTSGEMQSLNFCPADAELLPVVFED